MISPVQRRSLASTPAARNDPLALRDEVRSIVDQLSVQSHDRVAGCNLPGESNPVCKASIARFISAFSAAGSSLFAQRVWLMSFVEVVIFHLGRPHDARRNNGYSACQPCLPSADRSGANT